MNETAKSRGFTLIELLIAVVILSVGLLGLAGMQITGLRSVNSSSSYTQATLAVNDLVERIRANPVASDNNAFLLVESPAISPNTNSTDPNLVLINCAAMPNPYCSEYYDGTNVVTATSCTPDQMAAYDINTWFCGENNGAGRTGSLSSQFPQAEVRITCNDIDNTDADACTYGSRHTVSLSWRELDPNRDSGNPNATINRNITLTIQP
jgi:type IV pilus assembly protein PilV